ncbi:ROK family protein [Paenibacillus sp. UNC496MF]|uniref:ROK family protein n=1 Tax=Paenibacillus sp. UNC496MF TaxID=1502753 RepID=UPI000B833F2C|nr:ROK family protein [Paenibacillus sp. UNC496MF]
MMNQVHIGVDIGGTNTAIGLFDQELALRAKRSFVTSLPHYPGKTDRPIPFLDELAERIFRLIGEHAPGAKLAAVGMGVPGRVDPVNGIALAASNLAWANVPVAAEMSERLGVPVYIDNDVRIFMLGEAMAGAAKGSGSVIGVTLGTGMAAAVMVDGKMWEGHRGFAGELGHDQVPGYHARCNCGGYGCLETIASATGIARLGAEAAANGRIPLLHSPDGRITARDVYLAAMAGDSAAADIFRFVGATLGSKLTTAVYLLNPEMIIVGGGAAAAGELLLGPLREAIYGKYRFEVKPAVVAAALGDSAGLYGGVHYAIGRGGE